jgi:hypothetical protein
MTHLPLRLLTFAAGALCVVAGRPVVPPADAQNSSTYQNSCGNLFIEGATLVATCRRVDGSFHQTFIMLEDVATLATGTAALSATQRDKTVREGQAVVTELDSNASATTYWVSESDGWHVVTTVDTVIGQDRDGEKHAAVRFSSLLLPGQSQLISVPSAIGERQQVLRIGRLGDQIEVARVHGSSV